MAKLRKDLTIDFSSLTFLDRHKYFMLLLSMLNRSLAKLPVKVNNIYELGQVRIFVLRKKRQPHFTYLFQFIFSDKTIFHSIQI